MIIAVSVSACMMNERVFEPHPCVESVLLILLY